MIEFNTKYYENDNMLHGSIRYIMGTRFDMLAISSDKAYINNIWEKIVYELVQLNIMLNRFDMQSEASFINSYASIYPVHISKEMSAILHTCQDYYEKTLHLFDITLKNFRSIKWCNNHNIFFEGNNILLDFGGFAKGYALKKIKDILFMGGVKNAFVDFGNSSILAVGHHPYGNCWKINLINPYTQKALDEYELKDISLSTSGNTPQNLKHIINPLTGIYKEQKEISTIMTDDPLDAEVLSTVWLIANDDQKEEITNIFKRIKTSIHYL